MEVSSRFVVLKQVCRLLASNLLGHKLAMPGGTVCIAARYFAGQARSIVQSHTLLPVPLVRIKGHETQHGSL